MADAFCGPGVTWMGEPDEGKLKLVADYDGLFKADIEALAQINMLGDVMCASRHTDSVVRKGEIVAATRAIPLVVKAEAVERAVGISVACGGIFQIKLLKAAKTAFIITGNEVYNRLIEDQFEPVLRKKIEKIGSVVTGVVFAPDEVDIIEHEIRRFLSDGADLILTTGGMSVDPDDVTRLGVQRAGGEVIFYGAPVIPGAMFMLAYIGNIPVLGVPACGIYHETTILDLLLPRILAGEKLCRKDIALMGHGGLCLNCPTCRYPVCPFGK
jgi:molybdopterin biosynthesis enzyme